MQVIAEDKLSTVESKRSRKAAPFRNNNSIRVENKISQRSNSRSNSGSSQGESGVGMSPRSSSHKQMIMARHNSKKDFNRFLSERSTKTGHSKKSMAWKKFLNVRIGIEDEIKEIRHLPPIKLDSKMGNLSLN